MKIREKFQSMPTGRRRLFSIGGAAAVLLAGGLVFSDPLIAWFTIAPKSGAAKAAGGHDHGAMTAGVVTDIPQQRFDDATVDALRAAIAAYEFARTTLANDSIEGIDRHGDAIAEALRRIDPSRAEGTVEECAASGIGAAEQLRAAATIDDARNALKEVGRFLIPLAGADERIRGDFNVYLCSMTEGFNKWIQRGDSVENPYWGQSMLECGEKSDWTVPAVAMAMAAEEGHDHSAHGDYYTCPMHPSVKQEGPGKCPLCGMDLTKVSAADAAAGVLIVDEGRRQKIGVKTAVVSEQPMVLTIRAVGRTAYDEKRISDVTLKLNGFIEKLYVNETGQPVRKGQPLLAIYSPELYAAQQELLLALESQRNARQTGAPDRADYLVRAARQRLRLWDLTDAQIDRIVSSGQPMERVPILSPASGFVIEKDVFEGAAVSAGMRLFRIAQLDRIWVEADVYEADLGQVRVGQNVFVTLPYVAGSNFEGKVSYIYPWLDPATRTGRIRVELPNREMQLKPDMYANAEIRIDRGSRLVVPVSSVIHTGPRTLVFLDLGEGKLQPKQVKVGMKNGDFYEVLDGVSAGDRIVTSANFLIASESRIRSAEAFWGGDGESAPRDGSAAGAGGGSHAGH